MKRTIMSLAVLALLFGGAVQARASLMAHAPVNGLNTFEDTSTGRVWLQLPDLFSLDYPAQLTIAGPNGFTVATFADINQLGTGSADITGGQWAAVAAIIGSSGSRGLMWGNYADTSSNAYYYAYDDIYPWGHYNPTDASAYTDLGLWAYQSGTPSAAPEPATLAILGLGLAGLGFSRRKRAS